MGEDTVSGLMLEDDFVGISETPEGLPKLIEKALEKTREWRLAANVKKCALFMPVMSRKIRCTQLISVGSGEKMNYRS